MQFFLVNLFLLIPLVTFQGRYESVKVLLFLSGSFLLCVYWILNIQSLKFETSDKWYMGWLVSLLLSSFLGTETSTSIFGGSYRHQGFIFFFGLWLLLKLFSSFKYKSYLNNLLALVVLIESIVVLFFNKLGTLGDTNAAAGFIAVGLFFLNKYFLLLPAIALIVGFSKAGFLSLVPYIFKKVNFLIILFLVALMFWIKPVTTTSRFENRQVIWSHSVNLILDKPLMGYGAESDEVLFDKKFYESGFPLSELIIDRAHNIFLDITIWSGLVGLFFFIGFLYSVYKGGDETNKKMLISFLIFASFQPLSTAHWILFALII